MKNIKFAANYFLFRIFTLLLAACLLAACGMLTTTTETPTQTATLPAPEVTAASSVTAAAVSASAEPPVSPITLLPLVPSEPSPTPLEVIRFAVIGDYGEGSQGELDVSNLVKSWEPDFIITVGDNNYPIGSADTIDQHIGEYYHEYIYPYRGIYGEGADRIRFFPTLGNHDYDSFLAQPYLDYFELPGNERYYDFNWGPVYFLALDSDSRTPDGVSQISTQAQWAQSRLAESQAAWKVVYFHHAPYSSGYHGPVDWMRWPFAEWGASVVLSGHDHTYERLLIDGIPYFVNGVGGGPIYSFLGSSEGSQFRYNDDYGAMLVEADTQQMTFSFFNRRGELIDSYQINNTR